MDPLMVSGLLQRIAVVTVAMLLAAWSGAAAAADGLVTASSDDRLWLVRPALPNPNAGADRPRLLHHALEMGGPYFSRGPALSRLPEAIAAAGDRAWLVFPPQEREGEMRRDVYTVRMQRDPALGIYRAVPTDRLVLAEALPGWGRLAGFAAGDAGPVALVVPHRHETVQVRREGREARDVATEVRSPQLLAMQNQRWQQVPLPEAMQLNHADAAHVAFDGPRQDRFNVLVATESLSREALFRTEQLAEDAVWEAFDTNLDPRQVLALISANERLAVVARTDESAIALSYLRDGRSLSLGQLDVPVEPWAIQGMADGFRLVTFGADGDVKMQRIGAIDGALGETHVMTDQPLPAAKLWHTGLMLAVSVIAVLIVLLVRPGARGEVQLPKHTAILPAASRLIALLIDLAPGAVLATLITRAPPPELLRLPILAESLDQAWPHLLMLGITFVHCTIIELLTGASLGKMLVGAGVASADGERPTPLQVLIRNGVKLMILIVPPLAVFALLNPHMQGFNDMAARTVVLREDDEPDKRIEDKQ